MIVIQILCFLYVQTEAVLHLYSAWLTMSFSIESEDSDKLLLEAQFRHAICG